LKTSLNEKLHNVYIPPNNTGLITLRVPECVACMGGQTMNKKLFSGNVNLKDHSGGILGGRVVLWNVIEKYCWVWS